ncbi:MAG TPA: hypothetical protein PKO27_15310 [Deltaproteobacteria bacterium]|nr:hypothetical protein [Deltaproteobacteria bacterium]
MDNKNGKSVFTIIAECMEKAVPLLPIDESIDEINRIEDEQRDQWIDALFKIIISCMFVFIILFPVEVGLLINRHDVRYIILSVILFAPIIVLGKYTISQSKILAKVYSELNATRSVKDEILRDRIRSLLTPKSKEND